MSHLEKWLQEQHQNHESWLVAGEKPTIADIAVFPYVAYIEDSSGGALSFEDYPHINAWVEKFKGLAGYVAPPGL